MSNQISDGPMVKSIGASGQISLGKEFAGRQVLVESPAKGVWIIRTATIIPDHEKWTDSSSSPKSLGKQRTAKTEI
jgi:hypothetical protein